jgi:prolipoprotein diacylglyceryltransferase
VSGELGQAAACSAAFWVALHRAMREPAGRAHATRTAGGLALGALLAHLGWAALHADALREAPAAWLDPSRGYCVLFVPFGVLALSPRADRGRRAYLDASLGALPLAFAVARLGCLAAGCCAGRATDLPWAAGGAHPTPFYDVAACAGLQLVCGKLPRGARGGAALAGLGLARLALEPLRADLPLGKPALEPAWLAALLVALGALLLLPARGRWRPAALFG